MFNRVIIGMLFVASVVLSEPCKAQVKQFGRTDVTVSGGKNPQITVLRQDVCSYPFFLQGTLAKSLSPGESVNIESCEMYWCTNRELLDECPGRVPENFKTPCKEATATLAKNGSSVSITFKFMMEKYKGAPVCEKSADKDSAKRSVTIPMGSTPPASGQSSSRGPSLGDKLRDKINCAEVGVMYQREIGRQLHPECR